MTLSFLPAAASTDKPSAGASLSIENSAVPSANSQMCVGEFLRSLRAEKAKLDNGLDYFAVQGALARERLAHA